MKTSRKFQATISQAIVDQIKMLQIFPEDKSLSDLKALTSRLSTNQNKSQAPGLEAELTIQISLLNSSILKYVN